MQQIFGRLTLEPESPTDRIEEPPGLLERPVRSGPLSRQRINDRLLTSIEPDRDPTTRLVREWHLADATPRPLAAPVEVTRHLHAEGIERGPR